MKKLICLGLLGVVLSSSVLSVYAEDVEISENTQGQEVEVTFSNPGEWSVVIPKTVSLTTTSTSTTSSYKVKGKLEVDHALVVYPESTVTLHSNASSAKITADVTEDEGIYFYNNTQGINNGLTDSYSTCDVYFSYEANKIGSYEGTLEFTIQEGLAMYGDKINYMYLSDEVTVDSVLIGGVESQYAGSYTYIPDDYTCEYAGDLFYIKSDAVVTTSGRSIIAFYKGDNMDSATEYVWEENGYVRITDWINLSALDIPIH